MSAGRDGGILAHMGSDDEKPSREERLAARLRENLHRRKRQARALATKDAPALPKRPEDR